MSESAPRKDLNKVILPKESSGQKAGRVKHKSLSKKNGKSTS